MNLLQKLTLNNVLKIVAIIAITFITVSISYYFLVSKPKIANEKLAFDKEQQIAFKKDAEMKIKLENDKIAKETLLTNSKECQNYQTEIENKLKKNDVSGSKGAVVNELKMIFYSPKLNTCLYTYRTFVANFTEDAFTIINDNYSLVNIYTNEILMTIKTKDPSYQFQKSEFDNFVDLYK